MAGAPCCALDGPMGFTYVPNGTSHSYPEGEALPTGGLQPGDCVLFSWYGWGFENGVPVINDGSEWTGWIAGDHTGIVASAPDGSGYFSAVEGNTSSTSWDNGGEVRERGDRHTSQVCGWWRPPSYGDAPTVDPTPEQPPPFPMEVLDMIIGQDQFDGKIYLISGNTKPELPQGGSDPSSPGQGNIYVDEWLRMMFQTWPQAGWGHLAALNHDLITALPNAT
jgi:hypothetical protein